MNSSIPFRGRCGRFASTLRDAGRTLPAAVFPAIFAAVLAASPALAVRPDTGGAPAGGPEARGYAEHVGQRHLRKLKAEDLLEKGEQMRLNRLALKGEAHDQVQRRLNALLAAGRGEVRIRGVQTDSKGNRHIRIHQLHRGHPVIGADAVIHVNAANEVYAVGGRLAQGLSPDASPRLNAAEARAKAMAVLDGKAGARERQAPGLVIFDGILAYETTVEEPGNPPHLWRTYVDASTGVLLFRENRIIHAAPVGGAAHDVTGSILTGEGGSVATVNGWLDDNDFYFLRNNTNLWGVYDQDAFDWSQNTTGIWGTADRAAVSLARNMELIQQYVSQVSLRNSYDNAGAFATAYVHEGTNYVNAYWDGFGFHFGDGDGITAGPLTVLDISAHEYGHAITQYTSNLTYSYESGALNESYSDIYGALVEFWAQADGRAAYPAGQAGQSDWLMGEDSWLSEEALRDMRNPQRFGQPSYYLGTNWYTGSGDNGGVHYNSGVQNFAFYLLAEGGAGSNDGHPYSITGLGIEAAGEIANYSNMFLLTSGSQYADAREAWILAASTLGYNVQTVRDVWTACGVLEQVNNLAVTPSSLAFGNVGAGSASDLSLSLVNNGANPTTVTGLGFDNAAFSSGAALPLTVGGGSTVQVQVRFLPPAMGPHAGTVTITSNADDNPVLTVALAGTGTEPAGISVTPAAISEGAPVGSVVTATLTVANTGVADLAVTPHSVENAQLGPQAAGLKVLLLESTISTLAFEDSLRALPNVASLDVLNGYSTTPTLADLQPYDAVVVFSRYGWYSPLGIGNLLADYVDAGGSVVLMGANFHSGGTWALQGRIMTSGYSPLAVTTYTVSSASLATVANHPINDGVTALTTGLYAFNTAPLGTGIPLGTYSGGYLIGAYNPDKPIVCLNSWPETGYYGGHLLTQVGNALDFVAGGKWLSVAGEGQVTVVPQGAAAEFQVTLDASDIQGGTYTGSIEFTHNDPAKPNPLVVPVAFAVDGFRRLAVSPAALDFANRQMGTVTTLTLILTNSGDETTTLSPMTLSGSPMFSLAGTPPTILAGGQSAEVQVEFRPDDLGAVTATLTITSDAEDNPSLTVALTGTGTEPPLATLAPDAFTLSLSPEEAPADRTATLSNTGGDHLNWRIVSITQTGSPLDPPTAAPAFAAPAPRIPLIYSESNYAHPYVPGRVIVAFREGRTGFASSSVLATLGLRQVRELAKAVNPRTRLQANTGRQLVLLELQDGVDVRRAIDALRQDAHVAYAEPDYIQKAIGIPDDASFSALYGMHNTGQTGGLADADIDAPEAWDRHTGNKSVLIGVIDTGIDYLHPDLVANIWTNPGEIAGNGLDDDGNGYIDDVHGWDFAYEDSNPTDGHSHGTHCAGTIAGAGNNGVGVAGVMWTASLVALKFLDDSGSGATSDAVDAVNYANAMGIDITSNSWGGGGFSQALEDVIAAGGLFIAAAGNSGTNNDASPHYPSSYALDNVIAVAATDHADARASFSCFGLTSVDLGAPGVNTYSTTPGNTYQSFSGTSMATPHVSGAAGLVWTYNRTLSAAQVKAALMASVDPVSSLAGITVTGGRLNVNRALEEAGPSWLAASPLVPGVLAPGESAPITVTVDPAGLVAGQWTGIVMVETDDPAHPELPISVTADISGCRSLAVEPGALDFGDRFTGTVATLDLALRNDCNDVVTVTAVALDDADFVFPSALPLEVPPFGTVTVPVEFHPAAAGANAGELTLTSDADADPIKTVALSGVDVEPPVATVNPAQVTRTLSAGNSTLVDVAIGNTGGSDLTWTLSGVSQGLAAAAYDASHFAPQDRNQADTRVGRPVTQASGGPDAFGYRWTDSDEPGGPAYQWQDIQATGTPVLQGCLDCNSIRPLSFAFPFYGSSFSQVNITSKGWVNFGTASFQWTNYPLPSTSMPDYLVAAFFDDLTTSNGGVVYFQDFGDRAVIQWQNVGYYSGSGTATFQIVLHADGGINYYYENITGSVLSATTGIQDGSRAVGLQVQYNTAYVKNHLAVRIRALPDWMRISEVAGTEPAAGTQNLGLTLDATGLVPGTYTQTMTLSHNNPQQPPLEIPVTLIVENAPAGSRVLRVGPSAEPMLTGGQFYMWNMTVGGETRGETQGDRYILLLK